MAQAPITIANDNGAAVRAAINAAFEGLATLQSGTGDPPEMKPYMLSVLDVSGKRLLRQRNAANNDWIYLGEVDRPGVLGAFMVLAQDTPGMTVHVQAGAIVAPDGSVIEHAAQNTGTITAPVSDPRHDLVVIDPETGDVDIVTGDENSSPSDPAVTSGLILVARIRLATSTTAITQNLIDDLRSILAGGGAFVPLAGGEMTGPLAIESDSASGSLLVTQSTAGQVVQRIDSIHADGNPEELVYQNTVENNGGPHVLITIPVPQDASILIKSISIVRVLSGGAVNLSAAYVVTAVARNVGGTVTIRGTPEELEIGDGGVFTPSISVSGTNVIISATLGTTSSRNVRTTARVYICG